MDVISIIYILYLFLQIRTRSETSVHVQSNNNSTIEALCPIPMGQEVF